MRSKCAILLARITIIARKITANIGGGMNIVILQENLREIERNSKEFARAFYQNLFLDYPRVKKLFVNTDIEKQEKKLLTVFVITISNLHDIVYLKKLLKSLGKRHLKYGVNLNHYRLLGDTLIKTLRSFMGKKWTKELETSWQQAYQLIVDLMLEGVQNEEIPEISDRCHYLPSLVQKLRIEAIAQKYLRDGETISKVKEKLSEDYYFQKLVREIGETQTLETITELLQKAIQRELDRAFVVKVS